MIPVSLPNHSPSYSTYIYVCVGVLGGGCNYAKVILNQSV